MNSKIFWLGNGLLITTILLSGCQHKSQEIAKPKGTSANVVATVNGTQITYAEYEAYKTKREQEMPNVRLSPKVLVEELVDMELLKQAAIQAGIEKRSEIKAKIEQNTANVLIQALLREKFGHAQYSDAKLKETYQKLVAKSGGTEYKARHILVKTKAEAEKIIAQLNKGANFATLAKKESTAPSAPQGGELGWFTPDTMVPPFTAAVEKLKKGQYTKTPVHTRFGWHVILLQNTRQVNAPTFKEVKPRLESLLTQRAIEAYVSKLRTNAKVSTKTLPIPKKTPPVHPSNMNPPAIKETTGQTPTT